MSAAALTSMVDEDWTKARELVQKSGDPAMATLYEWMLYRNDLTGLPFERIASFLKQHPDWPSQKNIQASAERNMPVNESPTNVLAWFSAHPPVTGEGIIKLLQAGQKIGQEKTAQELARGAWPEATISLEDQDRIMKEAPSLVGQDGHRRRLDHLLFNEKYTLARALARRLGNGYPELVEARIALSEEKPDGPSWVGRVPSSLQKDAGLLYERLRWRRRQDQDDGAMAILAAAPPASSITNPEDWWKERNILARRMIEKKNFAKAYALASRHENMEGTEYAEAEWLSGWLALRFMKKPSEALSHFQDMYGNVKTAVSKARGAYWTGRAYEAAGDKAKASEWFSRAAGYPKTYYGQIALLHLNKKAPQLVPVKASREDIGKIQSRDMVIAIRIAEAAGYKGLRIELVNAVIATLKAPSEFAAFSAALSNMGLKSEAFRVAKKAAGENYFLGEAAYPSMEVYTKGLSVDQALVHAVMRQESQFDPEVRSPAGALGLMQIMPTTAQHIAGKRGWDNRTEWLTSRPLHNVRLGSAYLNDLIERFNGAYPLAIAAYNAGPSRVANWLDEFGDPRAGQTDWIDWIELIPVSETRNYVQRVMEGYVVYREHVGIHSAEVSFVPSSPSAL
jgi:soluble lytic murein transglycosylase